MALPRHVRVKLSSEAAESISLTPVVVQETPDARTDRAHAGRHRQGSARIRELLLRGTLVSGASRFRWAGWDADREAIETLLATFPDPDPRRPFSSELYPRLPARAWTPH